MFKIIVVLLIALGIFCLYPNNNETTKDDSPASSKQTNVTNTIAKQNKQESFVMSLLPEKKQWPDTVQKAWIALNIKDAVAERIDAKTWVPITDIPLEMQQALLAIEDHNFYRHGAIDAEGILRATLVNLTAGEVVQGGSTITQQLTKNLFLSSDQTMMRKAEEAVLALFMEDNYSKDQLLEIYFNTTYFGAGATGIAAASDTYFGKIPSKLTLPEAAVIASLPYAPSALNPLENPEGCKKRQKLVLQTMVARGYIGEAMADKAIAAPVYLTNDTTL